MIDVLLVCLCCNILGIVIICYFFLLDLKILIEEEREGIFERICVVSDMMVWIVELLFLIFIFNGMLSRYKIFEFFMIMFLFMIV